MVTFEVPFLCAASDMFLSPGVVEQVKDGTTLRIRLFMPEGDHQIINIALAGVRSARVSNKQGELAEPWAEEVSFVRVSFYLDSIPITIFF
jgi:hypothetical protein